MMKLTGGTLVPLGVLTGGACISEGSTALAKTAPSDAGINVLKARFTV